jgi:flagellar hook protein FlgE
LQLLTQQEFEEIVIAARMQKPVKTTVPKTAAPSGTKSSGAGQLKFSSTLKTGPPAAAARGLEDRMCVQSIRTKYYSRMAKGVDGIQEEVDEFSESDKLDNAAGIIKCRRCCSIVSSADDAAADAKNAEEKAKKKEVKNIVGSADDAAADAKNAEEKAKKKEVKNILHYIRNESASEKMYENGIRDFGRSGLKLEYFLNHKKAKQANLSEAEVVAMRLYTTFAYTFMNNPLRDEDRYKRNEPCPLPVTTTFALDGIKKMRKLYATMEVSSKSNEPNKKEQPQTEETVLWRGMRNLKIAREFMKSGGTELAFMSTTTDVNVAVRYSLSPNSLLFKVVSSNFITMGAEVQWLSAFPGEAEILYPPLTYLKPTGRTQVTIQTNELGIIDDPSPRI